VATVDLNSLISKKTDQPIVEVGLGLRIQVEVMPVRSLPGGSLNIVRECLSQALLNR